MSDANVVLRNPEPQNQRSLKIKRALCGICFFLILISIVIGLSVILWIFYYSKIQTHHGILSYFPQFKKDASKISWAHRVNNIESLNSALQSDVHFLEADVMLLRSGNGDSSLMMAHPPETSSNLSLTEMLDQYKRVSRNRVIGLKLDFKGDDTIASGLQLVRKYQLTSQPIIMNADILKSDKDECDNSSCPVRNPQLFLSTFFSQNPGNWALSVGWSTLNIVDGYTWIDVIRMRDQIQKYKIANNHILNQEATYVDMTFPVRESKLVWESLKKLIWLVQEVEGSLTVFSSPTSSRTDETKVGLTALMQTLNPDAIYLDLGNYNESELIEMRHTRDNSQPVIDIPHFIYLKWRLSAKENSTAIANYGGLVFQGNDVYAEYDRGLRFSDSSPTITVEMVVQFVNLVANQNPSCQLVTCLRSIYEECDVRLGIDSSHGNSISKSFIFENIYQIKLVYNMQTESILQIMPSRVTKWRYQVLPRQDYRVFRNYQLFSNRTYYFRVSPECSSTNDRLVIENIVFNESEELVNAQEVK